jgi:hypothetical protein
MSGINEYLQISAGNQKIKRNEDVKKAPEQKTNPKADKTSAQSKRADQAQISDAARGMLTLRIDAKKYIEDVEKSKSISDNDVKQLKQKIENMYYINDDVIDKIVDKLVSMPNFLIEKSKS